MMPAARSLIIFLVLLCEAATSMNKKHDHECACDILTKPNLVDKEKTARWMVHSLDWGVVSTISTRLVNAQDGLMRTSADESTSSMPVPFGNIYSFVDGTCNNSTGTPYLYGTYMDQTFVDFQKNAAVSMSLSEASLSSVCGGEALESCKISNSGFGDPENPVCARLVLSGVLVVLSKDDAEYKFAKSAIFKRHASMEEWPENHDWVVAKIDVQDIWLIDFFGGASVLNVDAYKKVDLFSMEDLQV